MPIPVRVFAIEGSQQMRSKRSSQVWRLVFSAAVVAIGVGAWTGLDRDDSTRSANDDPTLVAAGSQSDRTTVPSTTGPTTTAPTTTDGPATAPSSVMEALLQPENPPKNPYEKVPVNRIGTIAIPRIGLVEEMYEGIWLTVLDRGPGHWPGTPRPGGFGNVVVAGHRVTHTHPFRDIDQLDSGDEVIFRMDDGSSAKYRVTNHEIVTPDAVRIVDQRPGHTLTLFACHPPGSAKYRYVVFGELVERGVDASDPVEASDQAVPPGA